MLCAFVYVLFSSGSLSCILKHVCLKIIEMINISTQQSVKENSFIVGVQNTPREYLHYEICASS